MKGLFLLLPLSRDLNINTIPLALVAEFIDAISLSEEPVRSLVGPLPFAESNQSSAPIHQAVSSSTNRKAHCSALNASVHPSKTFRLWMDEKRGNIWEGLMNLTYKLSIIIWLFPHRYKLYLWIYSWTNTAQSARERHASCVHMTSVRVMQLNRPAVGFLILNRCFRLVPLHWDTI